MYASGSLTIESVAGTNALCSNNWNEDIVITKNTGEPFSLTSLNVHVGNTVTIKGYRKGTSSVFTKVITTPGLNNNTTLNWDGLLKVEMKQNQGMCIDDVVLKT